MNEETRRWATAGHSPADQASLLKQIAEAEEEKKTTYFMPVPWCYYGIEYGLLKGEGRDPDSFTGILAGRLVVAEIPRIEECDRALTGPCLHRSGGPPCFCIIKKLHFLVFFHDSVLYYKGVERTF
jgi:hypothetical protein